MLTQKSGLASRTLQTIIGIFLVIGSVLTGCRTSEVVVGTALSTDSSILKVVFLGAPFSVVLGSAFDLQVQIQDQNGKVATDFRGHIRFTSNDMSAILPSDLLFSPTDFGIRTVSASFGTIGQFSIFGTDLMSNQISGQTQPITVSGLPGGLPTLIGLQPAGGPLSGGNLIAIAGSNLLLNSSVNVGGNDCPITSVTPSLIYCTAPSGMAGSQSVTITGTDANGTTRLLSSNYQYQDYAFTSSTPSYPYSPLSSQLGSYRGFTGDGVHFAAVTGSDNSVQLWNSFPSNLNQSPDLILEGGAGMTAMNSPLGLAVYDGKLIVADGNNARVLIWNSWPTSPNQPADVVMGQPDFTTITPGICASCLNYPVAVTVSPTGGLFIADTQQSAGSPNSVILYYNQIPSQSHASADFVIGAANLSSQGGVSGSTQQVFTISQDVGLGVNSNHLFVPDVNMNRVLVFENPPTTNYAGAVQVFGQTDYTSTATTDSGGVVDTVHLNQPSAAYVIGSSLYVNDYGNQRIAYWSDVSALASGVAGAAMDHILGPRVLLAGPDITIVQRSDSTNAIVSSSGMYIDPSGNAWYQTNGALVSSAQDKLIGAPLTITSVNPSSFCSEGDKLTFTGSGFSSFDNVVVNNGNDSSSGTSYSVGCGLVYAGDTAASCQLSGPSYNGGAEINYSTFDGAQFLYTNLSAYIGGVP